MQPRLTGDRSGALVNAARRAAQNEKEQDPMTTIGEVCNHEVVFTSRDTPIAAAARLMRQYHVGTVVIVDQMNGGKQMPVGIVTDRDLVVEVLATELDPKTNTDGDVMAPELATVRETEGLAEAMEIMRRKGVRRLPVVGDDRQLMGIVSIDDLLEVLAEQLTDLTRIVSREQTREAQARR
jgi:CBS domain-containing protein